MKLFEHPDFEQANRTPCDTRTLTRAARDLVFK